MLHVHVEAVQMNQDEINQAIDQAITEVRRATLLNRAATLADVGNVAAVVASDQARTLTATVVNISCGTLMN